ncbi:MAG: glutamyl-tRNA reductase [Treponema sp.]|nr:glutamyl-tRNA reductase [Treponema sp.]
MAGIDHTRADIHRRERFSFSSSSLEAALEWITRSYPHLGCVIIATCNRTELYLSGSRQEDPGPEQILLTLKAPSPEEATDAFPAALWVCRQGMEAVEHLFLLAGGLKSRIVGEHQILAQVKGALDAARKAKSTDPVLERLFQMAIACAKRIKTETNLNRSEVSLATVALERIQAYGREQQLPLSGLHCLVIGNGVIGRQTAAQLVKAGCQVTVTLRQHRQGEDLVPQGCKVIAYDRRYASLMAYTVLISATMSPHYTLTLEQLSPLWDGRHRLFIDLAVPRDMDPAIRSLEGVTLIDIDHLGEGVLPKNEQSDAAAIQAILQECMTEFAHWYAFRSYVGSIAAIQQAASADLVLRLNRHLASLGLDAESQDRLRNALSHTSQRVLGKLLFGLKDTLDLSMWEPCFHALETIALQASRTGKTHEQTRQELSKGSAESL